MAPKVRTILAFNGLGTSKLQPAPTAGLHLEIHQRSVVSVEMEIATSGGQSYIEALQAAAEVIKLRSDNVV
jgi:hypothetical protein